MTHKSTVHRLYFVNKYLSTKKHNVSGDVVLICTDTKLKVWSTVKIRGTRVPQKAIVPVGRPSPYFIIILNMRFIPKASLRASSQITASSYIYLSDTYEFIIQSSWPLPLLCRWLANKLTVLLRGCWNCLTQACIDMPSKHKTFVWLDAMLDQRRRSWADVV